MVSPTVVRSTIARLTGGLAALACGAALMSGCALLNGSSSLDDATEYVPSDVTALGVFDREAFADERGFDDVDPRDPDASDVADYVQAVSDIGLGTGLTQYAASAADAPFNEFDVRWYAEVAVPGDDGESRAASLYKVDDELDLSDFTDLLEQTGYTKGSTADFDTYRIGTDHLDTTSTAIAGYYPLDFSNVMVVPDEHLVVASVTDSTLEPIAAAIGEDADSLADDKGELDDLISDAEDATFATLARGDQVCGDPTSDTIDSDGTPQARSVVVEVGEGTDDLEARAVLLFDHDTAAEDDLDSRETLVGDGDFTVERDGDKVRITTEDPDDARTLISGERAGTGPAACVA